MNGKKNYYNLIKYIKIKKRGGCFKCKTSWYWKFYELDYPFSEDFIRCIKGCITQHHGKLEYGFTIACNIEESFMLNYADTVDATMNKIEQIKEKILKKILGQIMIEE